MASRRERYQIVTCTFHRVVDQIAFHRLNGTDDPNGLCTLAKDWQESCRSLIGSDRFNTASRRVLAPAPGYLSLDDIWNYVHALHEEILRIKEAEDRRTMGDLASEGDELARGHHNVGEWKIQFDDWVDEIEERLLNNEGDETAAAAWLALVPCEVYSNQATEQQDRVNLFGAIARRIKWIRKRINERKIGMNVTIGMIGGGNNQFGQENNQLNTTQTLQLLEDLAKQAENTSNLEERRSLAKKFTKVLEDNRGILGTGAEVTGRFLKALFAHGSDH